MAGLVNYDPAVDVHLTEAGVKQAEALAQELKDVHFDAIYVSRLKRTRQTAEIINRYHHLKLVEEALLDDIRNGFEGKKVSEAKKWRDAQSDPIVARYQNKYESVNDMTDRARAFLEKIKGEHQDDETILVVTSSHMIKQLRMLNNEITLEELIGPAAKYASCYIFDV